MKKSALATGVLFLAGLHAACASVQMVGYGDGTVKTSTVSYSFVGPPLLADARGKSYDVVLRGVESGSGPFDVQAFEKHGMTRHSGSRRADVRVEVSLGSVQQGEPGAMKLGDEWYPAFQVSVPYDVTVADAGGAALAQRRETHTSTLTFRELQGFDSREQAVGAIDTIRKLAAKGVEKKGREGALADATRSTNELAASLFQKRNISMDVPVVRSAAGVDLEAAYELVASAENPDQVQQALETYERTGTQHVKADGSPNDTAGYGVACGIAACRLLLRDLGGAWEASKLASGFEPDGREVQEIQRVIYEQERITGERVIPEEDRKRIDSAQNLAGALQGLFGGSRN